jgi:hypothetical protein
MTLIVFVVVMGELLIVLSAPVSGLVVVLAVASAVPAAMTAGVGAFLCAFDVFGRLAKTVG